MFMRWNNGNQFPIIAPGYGYLSRVISGATAKWGNQKKENSYCITHSTLDFKNQFPIICTWLVLRNAHLRTSNESCLPFPESNKTLEQNRAGVCICIYWWGTATPTDGQFRPVGEGGGGRIHWQSDHSQITVRSTVRSQSDHMFYYHFTLLAWKEFTDLKGDLFFLWTSQVAGKIYDRTVIGLWSDCRSDCDRTVVGLLHGAHARASSL